MKTFLAQNQFISNSASHVPVDAGSAAVNAQPPSTAAAEAISDDAIRGSLPSGESDPSVMLDYAPSGMAATDSCQEPVAASPISAASSDNLGCLTAEDEALYWQLRHADNPFTRDLPDVPDAHALFDAIEPPPLFLQRQA